MSEEVLYPAATVRHGESEGLAVVMDLSAGEYLMLDRAASAMWRALVTIPHPADRLRALANQFEAPTERLTRDLESFRAECERRGLLQHQPAAAPSRARRSRYARRAWTARAWWSLLVTSRSLRRHGFPATFETYSRLPRPGTEIDPKDARGAERAFVRAESLFQSRSSPRDCLPRSLALYRFLLSVGVPADHCIGVRRHPFEAHAWVESGGRVLADSPATVDRFAELARI